MRIPVRGLEEYGKQGGTTENRMQRQTFQKTMQRPRAPGGELRPKPIAPNIFHLMLIRQRRHRAGGIFAIERLVQEEEIGKAPPDREFGFLK